MRSPNYPSITLRDAIQRIGTVFEAEHLHPASREVVAKDLGYSSLSGSSLPILGALRRYELLIDEENGVRVSDDAVTILTLPDQEPEYRAALLRVAFAPELFSDLKAEFGEKLPSDANLRHYLIRRKFLPKAADEIIRVYRDNLTFVGLKDEVHNEAMEPPISQMEPLRSLATSIQAANSHTKLVAAAGYREDVCSVAEGKITIQWPLTLSAESFQDLTDWLETIKRKIERGVAKASATWPE